MENVELKNAIKIRTAMIEYQDTVYLNLIRQLNTNCQEILNKDLGSEFVRNCGRDLAGEVVRNCLDTSDFHITVDQLAKRILEFSYDNEYDPLKNNGVGGDVNKLVYNYNELNSSQLDDIANVMASSQQKLFDEDRKHDPRDQKGKSEYRNLKKDENGDVYDELTGKKEDKTIYTRNGKEVEKSNLQADHIQARESGSYNSRYIKKGGDERIKDFWNSSDNMQMMFQSANSSKGDVRVCEVDGEIKYINARSKEYDPDTDITYKATPEQLADAACYMWEKTDEDREQQNNPKIQELKDKGYLDENGKVPKSVRNQLVKNIRHSQNKESITILKNTDYKQVALDAKDYTKKSIGKIIAGQIIYYAAPPLIYEVKTILKDKTVKLDNALQKLGSSAIRIGEYVFSKLKDIFMNIAVNSIKKFIKSFMDILINMVKATVKKLLKIAKNLVLSTVDAIRIIADPNADSSQKANSVCNLFGVTITTCVIDLLFELASETLHIPSPWDDVIFGPLQILATVICTNLTLLILQKADLFDVNRGFRMSQIRALFQETREEYQREIDLSSGLADYKIHEIIEQAKHETRYIYDNLQAIDMKTQSVRGELEKISTMFSMDINFEEEWLKFIGVVL